VEIRHNKALLCINDSTTPGTFLGFDVLKEGEWINHVTAGCDEHNRAIYPLIEVYCLLLLDRSRRSACSLRTRDTRERATHNERYK
jgi:hypothetical protein